MAKSCREPIAEEVRDKTRANFCDYFKPRAHAFNAAGDAAAQARAELESMFGGATGKAAGNRTPGDDAPSKLEELFGGGTDPKSGD